MLYLDKRAINLIKKYSFFIIPILFLVILIRNAWICDDAYITFRTVDNFIHGFGLRWNIAERVQSYTNPLWMFIISLVYWITHEMYYTSIILSIVVSSVAVLWFYFKICGSPRIAVFGIMLLACSKAFMDYTTSGLETPLVYLLLAVFFYVYYKYKINLKTFFFLSFIASLGVITRMDSILLFFPAVVYAFWQVRSSKAFIAFLVGFSTFFLWEIFSLIYYGFPFPNTAYAKLSAGIDSGELINQGIHYLNNSIKIDPITLLMVGLSMIIADYYLHKRKDYRLFCHSMGIILYLLYIIKIGGDFMSGRFFAVPFFSAVILFVCSDLTKLLDKKYYYQWSLSALFIFLLLWPFSPLMNHINYGLFSMDKYDISDDRDFFYPRTGLVNNLFSHALNNSLGVRRGLKERQKQVGLEIKGGIGFQGYYAGPYVHFIDFFALGDPLLAHIPSHRALSQRIGHFERIVPEGYCTTLLTGRNAIKDKNLAQYYEKLVLITRGNLFDWERLKTICYMNLGSYNHLVNYDFYRNNPCTEHMQLGSQYMKQNQIAKAKKEFELALKIDSNTCDAHNGLGEIYLQQKQYDLAEQEFKTVLQINSDNYTYPARAYNDLGTLYVTLGKLQEAKLCFEHALQLDPIHEIYQRNLAMLQQQTSHDAHGNGTSS